MTTSEKLLSIFELDSSIIMSKGDYLISKVGEQFQLDYKSKEHQIGQQEIIDLFIKNTDFGEKEFSLKKIKIKLQEIKQLVEEYEYKSATFKLLSLLKDVSIIFSSYTYDTDESDEISNFIKEHNLCN